MNANVPRVTMTRVLKGAARLAGFVWTGLDREVLPVFIQAVAQALRDGWKEYAWPDLITPEQWEWFDGLFVKGAGDAWLAGDIVWYKGAAWVCLQDVDDTSEPDDTGAGMDEYWVKGEEADAPVYGAALSISAPEMVHAVWYDNPLTVAEPRPMRWARAAGTYGVRVWLDARREVPDKVWIEQFDTVSDLQGDEWDEDTAYTAGEVVWFSTGDGECYKANQAATAGQSPETHPSKWTLQGIPEWFEQYLQWTAVGAYLKTTKGAGPQAKAADEMAAKALALEIGRFQEANRKARRW